MPNGPSYIPPPPPPQFPLPPPITNAPRVTTRKRIIGQGFKPFGEFKVKELKDFIKASKKLHTIKNYSKMKKPQLIEALTKDFYIENGILYHYLNKKKDLHTLPQQPQHRKNAPF